MTESMYKSMRSHPDIAPVFEMLDLADGSDLFSRALALVRDCFAESDTLRILSRKQLRKIMKRRVALVYTYEVAVVTAARKCGANVKDFADAMLVLPAAEFEEIRAQFNEQINEMKKHALDPDAC